MISFEERVKLINSYVDLSNSDYNGRLDMYGYDPSKPTILMVDDYESVVKLFTRLVRRMKLCTNFNIVYSSGNDASIKVLNELVHNKEFNVDIVITDITFGGTISIDDKPYNINGIGLVEILNKIDDSLLYRFITGHAIGAKSTPGLYGQYTQFSDDSIEEHLSYKDVPITTNTDLISKVLEGSKYESLL